MSAQDAFDLLLSQLRPAPAPAWLVEQARNAGQAVQAAQAAQAAQAMQASNAVQGVNSIEAVLLRLEAQRNAMQQPFPQVISQMPATLPESPNPADASRWVLDHLARQDAASGQMMMGIPAPALGAHDLAAQSAAALRMITSPMVPSAFSQPVLPFTALDAESLLGRLPVYASLTLHDRLRLLLRLMFDLCDLFNKLAKGMQQWIGAAMPFSYADQCYDALRTLRSWREASGPAIRFEALTPEEQELLEEIDRFLGNPLDTGGWEERGREVEALRKALEKVERQVR